MTKKLVPRISSTPLNDFARCARLWAFVHASGEDAGVGYAAGCGSVIHAILEHRIEHGEEPTLEQVMAKPGNYDPPSVPLLAYADRGIWEEAMESAQAVIDPWAVVPEEFEDVVVEQPLDVWGLAQGDTQLAGYIDLYAYDPATNTALVHDWKTRGKSSWRYAPDAEALATNRQLTYYAACVRQHTGASSVVVQHGNIMRAGDGKPRMELVRAVIHAQALDAFWDELTNNTLPAMRAVHKLWADPERRHAVTANRDACFDYGRCAQMRRCNALTAAEPQQGHFIDQIRREQQNE